MRSTGGFEPVRVWVSYESMAHGKSIRNQPKCLGHMKQCARADLSVVLVYGPWELPYEITLMPRSHAALEQFMGLIRVKN